MNEAYRLRSTDRIKSFLALEAFAASGSKASLLYISNMFMRGVELEDILDRAKHWDALAKTSHLIEASYRFGYGFYRLCDYQSAFDAFSWGAEGGYAPSAYRLASMYLLGKYAKKDIDKSKYLLEIATRKGSIFARKDLAHVLLLYRFDIAEKLRGVLIFLSLIYYQIDFLVRKIFKLPLGERYMR